MFVIFKSWFTPNKVFPWGLPEITGFAVCILALEITTLGPAETYGPIPPMLPGRLDLRATLLTLKDSAFI